MDRATLIREMRRIVEMESIGVKMSQQKPVPRDPEPPRNEHLSDDDLDLSGAFHSINQELPENMRTLENGQTKRKRGLFDEHY